MPASRQDGQSAWRHPGRKAWAAAQLTTWFALLAVFVVAGAISQFGTAQWCLD